MTKKMTTSNANITGASGEKAAVSDFNSSLSFQPGGNISGVLTLRTVFPQYKDSVSIREEIDLRSCPPFFIHGHLPVSRNFWTFAAGTEVYGSFMIPISNMCLILIRMLQSSHV